MANNIDGQSEKHLLSSAQIKTLVVGLGNPILGDDGVGWAVAEQVEASLAGTLENKGIPFERYPIDIEYLSLGGLSLMENLIGYQRVIIIDAMTTRNNPIGTVWFFPLDNLPDLSAGHLTAPHDTSLQTAIQMGRTMGAVLPDQIMIVAVEAEFISDFSEELSKPVEAAVPQATNIVMNQLIEWAQGTGLQSVQDGPEPND